MRIQSHVSGNVHHATGGTSMPAKSTIAVSIALLLATASTALAMSNPRAPGRNAVTQKLTTPSKPSPEAASRAMKAWYDHHELGYGT
jgi:hypothetical protein